MIEINIEKNKTKICELLESTGREGIHDLITYLKQSDFFTAPCSTKYHLCVKGGLAHHSLSVYNVFNGLCNALCPHIPIASRKIAATLHDTCKISAYLQAGNSWRWNKANASGHGALSCKRIEEFIELTESEHEMIRWHMGHYKDGAEFANVKNELSAKFPEAHLMYFADHISTLFRED